LGPARLPASVAEQGESPDSAIRRGEDLINGWKSKLTSAEIDRSLRILEAFGLDAVYDEGVRPRRGAFPPRPAG